MSVADVFASDAGDNGHVADDAGAPAGSLLERLRTTAARAAESSTITIDLPGRWAGQLAVRYRVLPIAELERYAELQGETNNVSLAIDLMGSCCDGFVGYHADGTPEELPGRLTYGPRLAELLGLEFGYEPTPAEVVTTLFEDNAMALNAHVDRLMGWMNDPGRPTGEASAPTG